jgi:ABC-type dipeptide/oligopeptide/nickel transport system permease subunit
MEAANPQKRAMWANIEARPYALWMTAAPWLTVLLVPHTARVTRSSPMQVRDSDFVRYAQGTGTPTRRILSNEIRRTSPRFRPSSSACG